MMLRPASTRWFEVLCPRAESVRAVAALASTGAVEIEVRSRESFPVQELKPGLAEYAALQARYGRYWARGTLRRRALPEAPARVLRRALAGIAAWRRDADPLIDMLQGCEEELTRLRWLDRILERIADSPLDFALVAAAGPVLGTFCAILPREADLKLPESVLSRSLPWGEERCHMFLGARDRLDGVRRLVQSLKGRIVEPPDWLAGRAREALARVRAHRHFVSTRMLNLYAELDGIFVDYDLAHLLGEVEGLAWFAEQVGGLELAGEHLVCATGWTDDLGGRRLIDALDRANCRALLRLRPPPRGMRPPQVLDNPAWMQPFELFARAFGVPGLDEADPTPVVALIVPLLFGYMFGDLGQGAVLVGIGIYLVRRRGLAFGRLLVAGGGSAMVFGLLFGSLFAREDLIPAIWVHPLNDPIAVLAVPLVFAVGLLSLGQILNGLGALWRGELHRWIMTDLGFLVLYLGLVAMTQVPDLRWLALLGAIWFLAGSFWLHRGLVGAVAAVGQLLESGMQILVNTLSFARVGAFALAHAALSAAVLTMAESAPWWAYGVILVAGNVLILALEGLVVSIQTTRLVLFEFFNRFLRGTGRVFKPLRPPPAVMEAIA